MSTTLNDSPPVVGEQLANDRLDALIAEHGLPAPSRRNWCDHGQHYKSLIGQYDMIINLAAESDVTRWADALGVPADLEFKAQDASSLAPGTWSVTRSLTAEVPDWLGPACALVIKISEHRLVYPAGVR